MYASPLKAPAVMVPSAAPQTFSNDVLMRSIKILDIGYITVLYFGIAISLSVMTDKIMGKFDPVEASKKTKLMLLLEVILHLWCYGVMNYIVKNIVELVPFPLDGYQGFQHKRVKELGSGWVFGFVYIMFSSYLKDKISFIYNYYVNTNLTALEPAPAPAATQAPAPAATQAPAPAATKAHAK
jgi:hypothetical protein